MLKLYNGDCLKVMSQIPDQNIDFILTDPPYGTTNSSWDQIQDPLKMWEHFKRILKPTGSVAIFASDLFAVQLINLNPEWFKYMYIWAKKLKTGFLHAKNRPMTAHELILIFSGAPMGHKSLLGDRRMIYNPQGLRDCHIESHDGLSKLKNTYGKRPSNKAHLIQKKTGYPSDVLYYDSPGTSSRKHPNEKPIDLLEFLIRTYTDDSGSVVLDAFMGSGSTGKACLNTDRSFIGFEKDPEIFNSAKSDLLQLNLIMKGALI